MWSIGAPGHFSKNVNSMFIKTSRKTQTRNLGYIVSSTIEILIKDKSAMMHDDDDNRGRNQASKVEGSESGEARIEGAKRPKNNGG